MNLLDQKFPKSNKLHAIFNRNTVKVSYSCTQNMSSMIKYHNKKVIKEDAKETKSCNCRVKSECPLNGQCQVTDIIYKCTVLSPDKPNKVYLGTAASPTLVWCIAKKIPPYSNISKKCLLCLHEKLEIINYPQPEELLNKRSELISKCWHVNKFLLRNYKAKH